MIILDVTQPNKEKLNLFCKKNNLPIPNVKISIYKNRQDKYKGLF